MPILSPHEWPLQYVPEDFESPFPSAGGDALTRKLQLFLSAEQNAALQANAYKNALAIALKNAWTSPIAGGIRQKWLEKVSWEESRGDHTALLGLFTVIDFTATVDKKQMVEQAVRSGLRIAQNVISAVPVVGKIISAVIDLGLWIADLARKDDEEEVKRIVPWQAFRQDADTDFTRAAIKAVISDVDWTSLFAPSMSTDRGFSINETELEGNTRTFGSYSNSDPDYTGAAGFMPGTQRIVDVIQIAQTFSGSKHKRIDAVTNLGDYTPSLAQLCTAVWQFVEKRSSGDMYKVQSAYLIDIWKEFFDAFFFEGFEIVNHYHSKTGEANMVSALFAAKALASMVYVESRPSLRSPWYPVTPAIGVHQQVLRGLGSGFLQVFTKENLTKLLSNDGLVDPMGNNPNLRWRTVHRAVILPTLESLKQRQKSLLARSVASAYVRPKSLSGMPSFAAFRDPGPPKDKKYGSYGEELTAYCVDMRERFLSSRDRYLVRDQDAIDVDPVYGKRLASSKKTAPDFPVAATQPSVLDLDAEPAETPSGPKGGAPFESSPARRKTSGVGLLLAGTAAAAIALKKLSK